MAECIPIFRWTGSSLCLYWCTLWLMLCVGDSIVLPCKQGCNYDLSQGYGFSSGHVWIWELDDKESWALKNWCFWTVVLEKNLESPWIARRSNLSILKGISPDCSLEGLMLATSCKELTHLRRPWCWAKLRAGREGDDRGWDVWMASPTRWTWVWVDSGSWW